MLITHDQIDLAALEVTLLAALSNGPIQLDRITSTNTSHPEGLWQALLWNMAYQGQIVIYTLSGQPRHERSYVTLPKFFPPPPLTVHVLVTSDSVAKNLEYSLTSYAAISEVRNRPAPPPTPEEAARNEAEAEVGRQRVRQRELEIVGRTMTSWNGKALGELRLAINQRRPLKPAPAELAAYYRQQNRILLQRRRDHLKTEYRRFFSGKEAPLELLDEFCPMNQDLLNTNMTEEELFGEAAL